MIALKPMVPGVPAAVESQVRTGLHAGGKWIRTIGPPPEIVVDPSGSRRDHRAKYGCLSARPRVRCLCPPGKTQHLLLIDAKPSEHTQKAAAQQNLSQQVRRLG